VQGQFKNYLALHVAEEKILQVTIGSQNNC